MFPFPSTRRRGGAILGAAALLALALGAGPPRLGGQEAAPDPAIEPAVVLIEVTSQHGDWYTPWQAEPIQRATGSGFLVDRDLVMTNAHVVSDARQILVRRDGRSDPAFAEVAYIAHDSDLALLDVQDPAFDDGVPPLELGRLPSLRTRVRTYGYPAGGEKISRTEGVVSRLEFITYLHSGADAHLAIQTDSAINPGNSGGPVVQDGKVVGVAFQTNTRLNDVGFFIPTPIIRRFREDIADGRYDGYGELGMVTSNLVNPTYRDYLGLPDGQSGVVLDRLLPGASAEGHLRPDDVILAINGVPIANDGTVDYRGYSVGFQQIAEDEQMGAPMRLRIWRDGARRTVRFPLGGYPDAERMRNQFDRAPHYYVYAGLVFMVLNQELLRTFGNAWQSADKELLYTHFYLPTEAPEEVEGDVIVLSRVLPHEVNSAYRRHANAIVEQVNGRPVDALADLPGAFAAGGDTYHVIELRDGQQIVLDRAAAEKAHPDILDTYGIRRDRRIP